jgi:hypothetical protein
MSIPERQTPLTSLDFITISMSRSLDRHIAVLVVAAQHSAISTAKASRHPYSDFRGPSRRAARGPVIGFGGSGRREQRGKELCDKWSDGEE